MKTNGQKYWREAFLLFLFFVCVIAYMTAQNTGKDSVAVETGILRFREYSTTAELQSLGRPVSGTRAIAFNDETQSLWAYNGTQWIDLGLAPIAGGVDVDVTIQDGSSNPVENNAVHDRFVTAVDVADDSPNVANVSVWWGTKAQYEALTENSKTAMYVVIDSVFTLTDMFEAESRVNLVDNVSDVLQFTGQGQAFNGSVDITLANPGLNTDDQSFNLNYLTESTAFGEPAWFWSVNLDHPTLAFNGDAVDISKFYQDASEVGYTDDGTLSNATNVQDAIDNMFTIGSYVSTFRASAIQGGSPGTETKPVTVYYTKSGNMVQLQFRAEYNTFGSSSQEYQGTQFTVDDLPPGIPAPSAAFPMSVLTDTQIDDVLQQTTINSPFMSSGQVSPLGIAGRIGTTYNAAEGNVSSVKNFITYQGIYFIN